MSTEGFFRKSTFCTLTEAKPGFEGHWDMQEIFLLNGTSTMLASFFVKHFFHFHALVQKCHFENCQFGNIEPLHDTFEPMHGNEKSF